MATLDRHAAFRATRHFGSLDGLRAISVLLVIWHHAVQPMGPWGYLGVSAFFALSGFLITTLLLREREDTGSISLRDFYIRRSLRIFPLYYAVVALYLVLVTVTERGSAAGAQFLDQLPFFLTYTSNWFVDFEPGTRTIFYFAWSLATEEQFYLFWPFVVLVGRRWPVPVLFMLALFVADLGAEWAAAAGMVDPGLLPVRILTSVAAPICLGCLAAYATHHRRAFPAVAAVAGTRWSAPLLVAAVAAAVLAGAPWLVTHALLVLMVVACCLRPDHLLAPVLANRVLRYVGTISYGMYLLHMLALNAARRLLPDGWHAPGAEFLVGVLITVVAASVSYHSYERWFLRWKDRFRAGGRRRPVRDALQPSAAGVRAATPGVGTAPVGVP